MPPAAVTAHVRATVGCAPSLAGVFVISRRRFEQLVGEALDEIPEELGRYLDNVAVVVADDSPEGLLGLYEGTPLTERYDYGAMQMPDRITIFRKPICEICVSEEDVVEEIYVTIVHEVAHHFGIEDDTLEERGWA
jgi:predicted Zn-dependent protease with MMP-like domain